MYARFNGLVTKPRRLTTPSTPALASFAREVAEPSRASMLVALMDGRAWTVGELALQAGIARNTASEHIRRLVRAGLVSETRQGRHCYLRLAGPQIASAVESMSLASQTRPAAQSLRARKHDEELAAGRTCYRHLAGQLGVELLDGWLKAGYVTDEWGLTDAGRSWFARLSVDTRPDPRRELLRPCIDWTERRPHAAGILAERLAAASFEHNWVTRGSHPRAVRLTLSGEDHLHLKLSAADSP